MPEYLAPGVYVEETSFRAKPIAGVSTNIAGFIGKVDAGNRKYSKKPLLVESWKNFINIFGDFDNQNKMLVHGIKGFFENGGQRCWVAPLSYAPTENGVQHALDKLARVGEISLVLMPGITDTSLQKLLIRHCDKSGNCFDILDAQPTRHINVNSIKGHLSNNKNAAIYFPRILVLNPLSGKNIYIHPSGHIAGIYARVDTNQGVHKVPANESIQGAIDVELVLSGTEQNILNPAGINVIRKFNNRIVVWGARTLGGDANGEWKYLNVRRLFIYLEESIMKGTEWVVFEQNNERLWAKIRQTVSDFLIVAWRTGALQGPRPEDAYFVKCDQENNTQKDIDLGRVIIDVGVALIKPAEFVIMRIVQKIGGKV